MTDIEGVCRSCRAPVLWLTNAKTGKVASVEPELAWGGNLIINRDAGTYTVVPFMRKVRRYRLHFPRCPATIAERRRKPKRGELPFELP